MLALDLFTFVTGDLVDFAAGAPPFFAAFVAVVGALVDLVGALVGVSVAAQNTLSSGISLQTVVLIHSNPSLTRAKPSGRPVVWRMHRSGQYSCSYWTGSGEKFEQYYLVATR